MLFRSRWWRILGARVVGVSGAGSEPREDDGDAAADGFAGSEGRFFGEEEDGLGLSFGLPGGDVRALEEELGGAGGCGDARANEAAVLLKRENARNGKGCVELIDCLH